MSIITITDENGSRVIDMAPVDELVRRVSSRQDRDTPRELELLRELGRDQLQYAMIELMGLLRREQGLTQFLYTAKGQEHIADVTELKQAAVDAGFELWPECPAGL